MGIVIILAIVLSFAAMAMFTRARGLRDKIAVDHDPARGNPRASFNLAVALAVAAAIAWITAAFLA